MDLCPECGGGKSDQGALFPKGGGKVLVRRCLGCDRCCDVKTGEVVN